MTLLMQFVVSFGFILPVNAPQNMLVYGTDTFTARDFIKTGLVIYGAGLRAADADGRQLLVVAGLHLAAIAAIFAAR